jgi:hypothetical protein
MARPKKTRTVDTENKTADELIQMQAELKGQQNQDEPAPDELDINEPVDENPDDGASTNDDEFDLSSLDGLQDNEQQVDTELQHKYDVLQGKYTAETKRLSDMLSQTMAEVQELKTKLAQRVNVDEPIDETAEENLKTQYPALYKGLLAIARKEARGAAKDTDAKVENIIQDGEKSRRIEYYNQLNRLVPVWEKLNSHPVFIKWLGEKDTFSGTSRENLIKSAFNRYDYETTAQFFTTFMKEKGVRTRSEADTNEYIAPDTSGSGRPQRGNPKTVITRAQIAKFYQDKSQGRFNGTDEDARKFEARIMQAVKEGNVRS